MSKRPPKKTPRSKSASHAAPFAAPHAAAKGAAFSAAFRGGGQPTIALPTSAAGRIAAQRGPSQAEIVDALRKGGAYFAAGRFAESGQIARLVLQFLPTQPDALHLLGLSLYAQGDAAEAARQIEKAIEAAGPHAALLVNLGNARRMLGQFDAAHVAYEKAQQLDPAFDEASLELAELLLLEDRNAEALEEMDRLIIRKPGVPEYRLRAVAVASEIGDFAAALVYCRTALEYFNPPPLNLMLAAAATLERLSQLDEAILWAERVLEVSPTNALALRVWAKARRRQSGDDPDMLAELRQRLEKSGIDGMQAAEARIVYAELANICDQLGDIPAAFQYFSRQNEKTRASVKESRIDAKAYLDDVEKTIATFTPDFVAGWKRLGEPTAEKDHFAPPVFIVGFPRSGTTLLDQILDAHPDIEVIEERPLVRTLRLAAESLPGGYPAGLATLTEENRTRLRGIYRAALHKARPKPENCPAPENRIIIDKMPLNLLQAGLIQRVFPEARFILALRHPADCVLSCFMQDFVPNGAMANFLTLEDTARLYDRAMTLWSAYAGLLPLHVCEVRYENIVTDLESEAKRVLDFLHLPWHEAVRDPAAHALARSTIRTPSYAQVTKPVYKSAMARWQRYETYLQPVLPLLADHINRFGYGSAPR